MHHRLVERWRALRLVPSGVDGVVRDGTVLIEAILRARGDWERLVQART
jgi:hypothetical protein